MTPYSLEIHDRDGESHTYIFRARDIWKVLSYVHGQLIDGNGPGFYGHDSYETVKLEANELVPGEYPDAITLPR